MRYPLIEWGLPRQHIYCKDSHLCGGWVCCRRIPSPIWTEFRSRRDAGAMTASELAG